MENERGHGFLLGSTSDEYAALIEHATVVVLLEEENLLGFGIALPDEIVRAGDLWQRRRQVTWLDFSLESIEQQKLAYFAQLAALPEAELYVLPLALEILLRLERSEHEHLFATTVARPVRNTAALPALLTGEARVVGSINENYAEFGTIESDIHYMNMSSVLKILQTPLGRRIDASRLGLMAR